MTSNNGMPGFGIGSFNVNGLGGSPTSNKRELILNWLLKKNEDIVALQETHSIPSFEKYWTNIWGGDIYFSHGTSSAKGTAILVKRNSDINVINHKEIVPGRAHLLEFDYDSVKFCLVNIYCSNNDDVEFLKTVSMQFLVGHATTILCFAEIGIR